MNIIFTHLYVSLKKVGRIGSEYLQEILKPTFYLIIYASIYSGNKNGIGIK